MKIYDDCKEYKINVFKNIKIGDIIFSKDKEIILAIDYEYHRKRTESDYFFYKIYTNISAHPYTIHTTGRHYDLWRIK